MFSPARKRATQQNGFDAQRLLRLAELQLCSPVTTDQGSQINPFLRESDPPMSGPKKKRCGECCFCVCILRCSNNCTLLQLFCSSLEVARPASLRRAKGHSSIPLLHGAASAVMSDPSNPATQHQWQQASTSLMRATLGRVWASSRGVSVSER